MDLSFELDILRKNSIKIDFDFPSELPVGISKFGGKPDLPPDFKWYYFEGEDLDGITENRPLSFLAQINCGEAKKYDKDGLLPSAGMLYFFYELAAMTWGFDPKDSGSARVFYYPGSVSGLRRTEFPIGLADEFKLPEFVVSFSEQNDWPDFAEFIERHSEAHYDEYNKYEKVLKSKGRNNAGTISKLLGYADLISESMLLECEEVSDGVYTGKDADIAPERLEKYKNDCVQWQLLLQLDSIQNNKFEPLWNGVWRIYFYIRRNDLQNMNFGKCWLIMQC